MKSFKEYIDESYPSNGKVVVVKGRLGHRYAVFIKEATKTLWKEYWYNIDPIGNNNDYPHLQLALNDYKPGAGKKVGKFYIYMNEHFAAREHPNYKRDDKWQMMDSTGVRFVERAFYKWLITPAGQNFIQRNDIADCLPIKNGVEVASGKRNIY